MKCPTKSYYLKSGRNFRQKELQYFEFQKEKFRKAKIIILLQKENQYNRKAFFPETKFYSELYLNPDMSQFENTCRKEGPEHFFQMI